MEDLFAEGETLWDEQACPGHTPALFPPVDPEPVCEAAALYDHVLDVSTPAGRAAAVAEYHANGYAVVCGFGGEARSRGFVLEQYADTLMQQEWDDRYRVRVTGDDGRDLDPTVPEDGDAFYAAVTSVLDKHRVRELRAGWCLHKTTGLMYDDVAFHGKHLWAMRENETLYELARAVLGTGRLWTDIDASIAKLPGEGSYRRITFPRGLMRGAAYTGMHEGVRGRIVFSEALVVPVLPGSHRGAFLEHICDVYWPLYKHEKFIKREFVLDPDRDPLGIAKQARNVVVPRGAMLLHHPALAQGEYTNSRRFGRVEHSMLWGMRPAVSRAVYLEYTGRLEIDDRVLCYTRGEAPKLTPTLGWVSIYPQRYDNLNKHMVRALEMLRPGSKLISHTVERRARRLSNGTKGTVEVHRTVLAPVRPRLNYVAPQLSALGRYLVGIEAWPSHVG